jgi:hypothetical protein
MRSMSDVSPLQKAFDLVGLIPLSKGLNLTYQALKRWERQGRLPRTEWTGETTYAQQIEKITEGAVPASDLLAWGKRRASEEITSGDAAQQAA